MANLKYLEIDLIEEGNGELIAFEIKWGNKNPSVPVAFANAYKNAEYKVVRRDNYLDII